MIQVILTVALMLCAWYGLAQKDKSLLISVVILLVNVLGAYFVWFPEQATAIAHYLGVGRGADLILYLWVVVSLIIILNLHLKLNAQLQLITELARHMAIQTPIYGVPANDDPKGDPAEK